MSAKDVVTRFAPSPTGFLHIGGARTALFNWLFARHHGGKFVLRIEDTDRARSTPEATTAILKGLKWLGLDWDGDAISQFDRVERHQEAAQQMLDAGTAYKCYTTKEEIEAFREAAKAEKRSPVFQSPWRDAVETPDLPFVVRLKAPRTGETVVNDEVQGRVTFKNDTMDDLVLLRSDGTPTYMLAVVVDDHDMGITHVIRGDDHLTNAARQTLISEALGWDVPIFAHIPLIHGPDGKKLSKRHGALGVEEYRDMGYVSAGMRNYLARLGWSHGNDEFFSTEQAIEWFGLKTIGKSPARFDFKKLENLSGQHIRAAEAGPLFAEIEAYVAAQHGSGFTDDQKRVFIDSMDILKARAKTIPELIDMAYFFLGSRPFKADEKASKLLDVVSRGMLNRLTSRLRDATWTLENLEAEMREFAEGEDLKLGKIAQPLRAALTGRGVSPSVFDMMVILGKDETLARLEDVST
ncbi:MAG: glutamate--tRNA ligase [Rhodobacteraceae bacterium]|nr:glutamate--tRNA ligase [Paracoccaceae bacterium]